MWNARDFRYHWYRKDLDRGSARIRRLRLFMGYVPVVRNGRIPGSYTVSYDLRRFRSLYYRWKRFCKMFKIILMRWRTAAFNAGNLAVEVYNYHPEHEAAGDTEEFACETEMLFADVL